MDVIYIFAAVAFFIWSIRSIFFFVNEWQRILGRGKFPRTSISHLFTLFFSPLSLITWFGVIFSIYVSISDFPLEYDQYFILGLFLVKAVLTFREISTKKLKIPSFNPHILVIIIFSLLLIALAFAFPLSERYLWLLLLDRLLFFFVCIPIFLVLFPSEIIDDLNVRRAVRKIKKLKKIRTVLIVGSDATEITYFIDQIMGKNKETVVVNDTYNRMSTIGRAILTTASDQTDYLFIAYSNTSLSSLESILREITFTSIIISKQGLGGEKKVFTIISPYVTQKTRLIIDDRYVNNNDLISKKKYIFTFNIEAYGATSLLSLLSTLPKKNKLLIKISYKDENIPLSVPLIGTHHVNYLIPSILFCLLSGVKKEEIIISLSSVAPLPGQFVEHRLQSGVTIIDATQVTDKLVLQKGLEYIKLYRKNKVIIFGIEDELTKDEIRDLTAELALATTILVISQKHQLLLRRLMRVGTDKVQLKTITTDTIAKYLRDRTSREDVVIFMGDKVAPIVESILLSTSTVK